MPYFIKFLSIKPAIHQDCKNKANARTAGGNNVHVHGVLKIGF
jgi:hypothetical protein